MKMKYGKYKGIELSLINSGYLKWLLEQDWFLKRNEAEILLIEKELVERDFSHGHFYEDKVII